MMPHIHLDPHAFVATHKHPSVLRHFRLFLTELLDLHPLQILLY